MTYLVGIDVGGTFTDTYVYDEDSGASYQSKTLTTPPDLSVGIMSGLEKAIGQTDVDHVTISRIIHGTTVATNAILEEKGARVGLLTTEGFEHVLHLARSWTPGPLAGWIGMKKPAPLAAIEDTVGVAERMSAKGEVVRELDEAQVRSAMEYLKEKGVQSLTVCLINSYANATHERRIAEIGGELMGSIPISLSSEILPEFREYERTMVTVMNAYIQPHVGDYLADLQDRIVDSYGSPKIDVVRSDGGRMSVETATRQPVHMILSGPAGGVSGARLVATEAGFEDFLTLDMGGTSTDVSVVMGGRPQISRETKVGLLPVSSPAVDVRSIGAGGGSIARVSEYSGALRVGPQSAGAEPGPACYGRGGSEPTVTDANAVLGYLPSSLAGGEMSLDLKAAEDAIKPIATALGVSVPEAAHGVLKIVNENMLGALRLVSVERGHNPADFALVAYGGAGPLHATSLADVLGSFPVIVPPAPGILCALGDVASDYRNEFAKTFIRTFDETSADEVRALLSELAEQAEEWLNDEGVSEGQRRTRFEVDVRYHRQGLAIQIPLQLSDLEGHGLDVLGGRFSGEHERAYGFRLDTVAEIVVVRAIAHGGTPDLTDPSSSLEDPDASAARIGTGPIYHGGRFVDAAILDRVRLRPGNQVPGPVVITQMDSTALILPGYRGRIDAHHNILIEPEGSHGR